MIKSYLYFLIVSVMFLACGEKSEEISTDITQEISVSKQEDVTFNEPEQLVAYVNSSDHGYYKEKEIGEIKFSALLKPIEYIKANEKLKGNTEKSLEEDDLQYFDLRITVKDFSMEFLKYNLYEASDYPKRVAYCSFEMQNDIYLIDGKDTLPCVFYHFERAFDVVPYGHFILAFKPTDKNVIKAKTLVYYDRLFDKGLIKMTFMPNDLIKVPKLINT